MSAFACCSSVAITGSAVRICQTFTPGEPAPGKVMLTGTRKMAMPLRVAESGCGIHSDTYLDGIFTRSTALWTTRRTRWEFDSELLRRFTLTALGPCAALYARRTGRRAGPRYVSRDVGLWITREGSGGPIVRTRFGLFEAVI